MTIRDKKLLLTIIENIDDIDNAILQFKSNDINVFLNNRLVQKCVVMSLINISEAIMELSSECISNENINWKQFKKLRNIAAHKYGAINFVLVWNIVNKNIPDFKKGIEGLIDKI
jgi:uncharacterized protein with HEPN domain